MCHIRILVLLCVYCLVFIAFLQSACAISFTELRYHNSTRVRRQAGRCDGFKCRSGECISDDQECDGQPNCKDGTDETNHCQEIRCPSYLFRCKYGACINADYECNGRQDCRDSSDETSSNCKKNISKKCSDNEFQCNSGQCIPEDYKCDGTPQCNDNSDETRENCLDMQCPGYTYRCAYGACVNGNSQCNGVQECYDGSDEDRKLCGDNVRPVVTKPPPTQIPIGPKGSCTLPEYPLNGYWNVVGHAKDEYKPRTPVDTATIIQVHCYKKHKLDGESLVICENGRWKPNVGTCKPVCPSIYSTEHMKVTCYYKNIEFENCTEPLSDTFAKFKCDDYYEFSTTSESETRYCKDGSWDKGNPDCKPACGKRPDLVQTLLIGGTEVKKGQVPWQVAIYSTELKILFCGGSLITPNTVLSAAHCVTTGKKAELRPKEAMMVAVGKYYRNFSDPRDVDAQVSSLKQVLVPSKYRGDIQNYLADIAILITEKTFMLNKYVLPVCLDWHLNYEKLFSTPPINGTVTGWGYTTETSTPSEVLKELVVPYVEHDECSRNTPNNFDRYLVYDKICAGYLNTGSSACQGDSGGGLVFYNDRDDRFYVVGIVSLSPLSATGGCDSNQYGLYTKVSEYVQFIYSKTV